MKEYTNQQIEELIDSYIHSERDRMILRRRYIDGIKFEKLAEEFGYSTRHTQRIVYKSASKIFKHLS